MRVWKTSAPWAVIAVVSSLAVLLMMAMAPAAARAADELKQYQGEALSPFNREYDNSIRGPQKVDRETYRLRVDGLVDKSLELTYDQVLELGGERRVVTMNCVEGWSERLLYDGVPLEAVLRAAKAKPEATWAVFHSPEGYSSALPLAYLRKIRALLGYKINGLTLTDGRGWPFQLVVQGQLGYKWVKWIERIELTDREVKGYWEKRGYPNDAPVK